MRIAAKLMGQKSHKLQAVTGLLLLVLTACGNFGMDDQQLLERANEYSDKGEIRAAVIELKNVLQRSPDNSEARFRLASIYLEYEDFSSAEIQFRRASEAGWNSADSSIGLAKSMLAQGKFSAVLNECVVEDAFPPIAQAGITALRAVALTGLGQTEDALESLRAGEQLQPDAEFVLQTRIEFLMTHGKIVEAAQVITRALERYPDSANLKLLKATLLAGEQAFLKADELLREIIALDPSGYITGHGRKARLALVKIKIIEQDYKDVSALIKPLYGRDPEAAYLGAFLAFQKGNYELAKGLLLKALKQSPDNLATIQLYGMVSYAQEDYEQAAYYLSKYVSANPDNLVAQKILSQTYMKLGHFDEAGTILSAVMHEAVDDAELLALAGINAFSSGDTRTGILTLERAVKAAPDNLILRGELATAYMNSGDIDRAIQVLQSILQQGGHDRKIENMLVMAYVHVDQHEQAKALVLDMLNRHPNDPATLTLSGDVFVASGNLTSARNNYTLALKKEPDYIPAAMALGRLEERQGNYEKAAAQYQITATSSPGATEPVLALARLALLDGNVEKVLKYAKQLQQIRPDYAAGYEFEGIALMSQKSYQNSSRSFRMAWERGPSSNLAIMFSRSLKFSGQQTKATQPLTDWLLEHPQDTRVRQYLGTTWMELGKTDKAIETYERVIKEEPDNVVALNNLSLMYSHDRNPRALEFADRALKASPNNPGIQDTSGWLHVQQGHIEKGQHLLEKALKQLPEAPEIRYHYAVALYHSGERDKALGMLKDLLAEGIEFSERPDAQQFFDEKQS